MKHNIMFLLPMAFILDLLIPFILAPAYKGYDHLTQVMSVLGNSKAPLHTVYNLWLIVLGGILAVSSFKVYEIVSAHSPLIALILFCILLIYASGGCILSGLFPVGESRGLDTLSEKIHGYGSAVGFMCLTFAPLFVGIYAYKINSIKFFYFSIGCFISAILCFSCFIMGDKPDCKNTFLAFEGLWQRLSLLFMYFPLGCLMLFKE